MCTMNVPRILAALRHAIPLVLLLTAGVAGLKATDALAQTETQRAASSPPASFASPPPSDGPRMTVFISDLHFGLGKKPDGHWSPKEDFRWPGALKGFLAEM